MLLRPEKRCFSMGGIIVCLLRLWYIVFCKMAQKRGFLRSDGCLVAKIPVFWGLQKSKCKQNICFRDTLSILFFLFFQQVFHVCVVTLFALLVKEDDERDAAEIEFLWQVAPFLSCDVNVLTLDVVRFEERAAFLWCVICYIYVFHGLVLVCLYLVAHAEHLGAARTAWHFPEINIQHVALVWLNDALENAVALGQASAPLPLSRIFVHYFLVH